MPWTEEKRKQVRNKREKQILSAALELFAFKGYHNTTMEDISKKAGIAKGLIYKYFDSKEKLFETMINSLTDIFTKYIPEKPPEEFTDDDMVELLISFFRDIEENYLYWRVFHTVVVQSGATDYFMTILNRYQTELKNYFTIYFSKKTDDVDLYFELYYVFVEGLALTFVVKPDLDYVKMIKVFVSKLS